MSEHDELRHELFTLSERLRNLEQAVPQMLQRLYRLEQRVGLTTPIPRAETTTTPRPSQPEPVFISEPAPVAPPAAPPASATTTTDLEVQIGGMWLARIGVVALMVGVILFLGLAFQRGWITPPMQVCIGLVVGLALLGLGEYFTRSQDKTSYGQGLTGGGIAVLYASVYAAYNFHHLIDPLTAFAFMVVVTAVGVGLSLRYDAVVILALSTLGGFLTPVFIQPTGDGVGNGVNLFVYMMLLDLGILATAYYKQWLPINLLVFAGTELLFIGWLTNNYHPEFLATTFLFATVFFLIFVGVACVYNVAHRYPTKEQDTVLLWANAGIYYGIAYWLLHQEWRGVLGVFTLALAALYVLAGAWALQVNSNDKMLRLSLFGIGITFAIIFVPVQLHQQWIGPAWATQAIVLTCIGFSTRSLPLRMAGLGVLGLSLIAVMLYAPALDAAAVFPLFSARFGLFVGEIAAMFLMAYLYHHHADAIDEQEKPLTDAFAVGGNALLVWALFDVLVRSDFKSWLAPAYVAQSLMLASIGFSVRSLTFRVTGIILLGLSVLAALAFAPRVDSALFIPIFNARFGLFLTEVGATFCMAYLYRSHADALVEEEKPLKNVFIISGNVLLLGALTAEVNAYFDVNAGYGSNAKQFAISALWAVYSMIAIVIGIAQRYQPIRLFALVVFFITIFKVFLLDLSFLDTAYRYLSFIALGVMLLTVAYLYQRYQATIREFALGERGGKGGVE
jgi:uncharacterized membrane protein